MTGFVTVILSALLLVPAFLIAIPVHEMGHAVAAYFLGDRSVRYFGYFKPDPRRFLDPLGVIAVFVALVGWGKRVPVQPNRIRTTAQRVILELGGPAANLLVGVALGLLLRFLLHMGLPLSYDLSPGLLAAAIFVIIFLNLSLFAFQLLPVPGLDGWNVVEAIFRGRNPRFFFNVNARRQQIWIGAVVVIFLFQIFQGANLLGVVMTPLYYPASLISLGTCVGYGIQGLTGLHPCPQ
ncbi:MAG TPA: site-2 protease family protein [Candidatus Dormibacteraeota bacterium]|nr:site-2 protease family protein [Candidatus Dormibacteraeota bacterium]